jgi:hypothetical protein
MDKYLPEIKGQKIRHQKTPQTSKKKIFENSFTVDTLKLIPV